MDDRLTFKLELPQMDIQNERPIAPRCHFSHQLEDVAYEAEPVKRRSKPWIDSHWSDPNDDEEGVPV